MKKQILFTGLILCSLISAHAPAFADHNEWWGKHDTDHDGRWNYDEFAAAQRQWEIEHHKHPMTDRELRDYYAKLDRDHDNYLRTEEARRAHHWW